LKFYGFKPQQLFVHWIFSFIYKNQTTFQSHPEYNIMFTKFLQLEALGIRIIILFFYKSKKKKNIFESSLSKDLHFYSFLSSRCLWEQFIFAFVWNRQPTKGPVKFYSFLASVVHCVQNRFTILLAWSYILEFTLEKTSIFHSFFGLSDPVWSKSTHF
jgi:hypothetical protein